VKTIILKSRTMYFYAHAHRDTLLTLLAQRLVNANATDSALVHQAVADLRA